MFAELKRLHQDYWQKKGFKGSFANQNWEAFHKKIICENFSSGYVQLLKITVGGQTLGVIYSLVSAGRVNMIQTGFRYDLHPKAKPGYVAHYLAIQYNLDKGMLCYDFLAGEARYKNSLANAFPQQQHWVVQRRKFRFILEDLLRKLYHRLS